LDYSVDNNKEETSAVLRAHGAQHSLFFAVKKGLTDELAAGIAAGQDVNVYDEVISAYACICGRCMQVANVQSSPLSSLPWAWLTT